MDMYFAYGIMGRSKCILNSNPVVSVIDRL